MLRKLCGDNLSKVIFVTTMWDQTSTRQGEQGRMAATATRTTRKKAYGQLLATYVGLGCEDRSLSSKQGNCARDIIKNLLMLQKQKRHCSKKGPS